MTEYCEPVNDFTFVRGDDVEVPFIMYTDDTKTTRKNLTDCDLFFTARRKWDRATAIFELSTDESTISVTDAANGEFKLIISSTISEIDPGAYGYDVVIVESGSKHTARVNAFEITKDFTE